MRELESVAENGVGRDDMLIHRMYGVVSIDGKAYRTKTTIHEFRDKENKVYDYKITEVELIISGSSTSNALNNSTSVTGAKLLEGVEKSYDKGKKVLDESENATVHMSALKVLPEIISNSIEAEIHADYVKGEGGVRNAENGVNRNDLLVHRIYGAVNIDGNTYRVKTTIHEFRDANTANTPHSYEATKIELIEDSTVTPKNGIDNPLNRSINSIPATKLLEGVEKSYDKGKKSS